MSIENLKVQFDADTRGFNKGVKTVQSGITGLHKNISGLVKAGLGLAGIGFGIAGIVRVMDTYRGMRNSVQRTNEIFQESSKYINHFAGTTARAFGMAESTAYEYAMTYGNLFQTITKDTDENAKVTVATLKASAVIASKTGRTMEDVNDRIRSGILGNTQAIESLGIYANVAMLETTNAFAEIAGSKSWNQLTHQQQQQIRTMAILEQASNQYGDSVSQIAGMSLPRLGQAFKDLVSYAGMFVTAGLQPVINALGRLVYWATAGLKSLANLFGLKIEGTLADTSNAQSGLASSTKDVTDAIDEQAKATKKAKNMMMGFDELNTLSQDDGADVNSLGAGVDIASPFDSMPMPELPEPEMPEIDTSKLEESLERLKGLFDFTNLKQSWANLRESLSPISSNIGDGLRWLFDNILLPFGAWTINDAVPGFLNLLSGAFNILNPLIEGAKPLFTWMWDNFLQPIASWTGGVIVDTLNLLGDALSRIGNWMSENQETVSKMTIAVAGFFAAWKLTELMAFISMSGGVVGALDRITKGIIGSTKAKIIDKWETIKITALYAKDFVMSLVASTKKMALQVKKWALLTRAKVLDAAKTVILTAKTWLMQGAQTALNLVMSMNPIHLVVLAIAGLVAAFVLLWNKCEGFRNFFMNMWDIVLAGTKSVGKGIEAVLKGIVNTFTGLINVVTTGLNLLFKGVLAPFNALIKGLNRVPGVNIPTLSLSIPKIPKLAKGGLAYGPTLAMVGDNPSASVDPEVISPLSKLQSMIVEAIQGSNGEGGGGDIELNVYLDRDTLLSAIIEAAQRKNARAGKTVVNLGGT